MVEKQPDALRLAERLEDPVNAKLHLAPYIAAELRRLHAENEDYGATCDHLIRENAEHIGEIVALKEQRDELLESLATCRANFRRHEEETLKMAQAEDEERASLRAQRDELLEALKGVIEVADFHELYGRRTDAARAAIAKATGETK